MKLDPDAQRRFALEVQAKLRAAGFTAYWAGGCVRDELLGRTPKDYDVATDAKPAQIRELFGSRRTLAVGEAFGVIVVVGSKPSGNVEVTTFRRDAGYSDGRRPDAVTFTDAEEDARRRDFTINAMFFDPAERRVIDFVGGQTDLKLGIVRAVGEARLRFDEDKLRMLRAVRMAATFGFALESETLEAVRRAATQITIVSPERIAQEMRGMFGKPGQARSAKLLMDTGLMGAVLPEVVWLTTAALTTTTQPEQGTAWDHVLAVLDILAQQDDGSFELGMAALLHESAEASNVVQAALESARRWKLSNDERDQIAWLIGNRSQLTGAATKRWSEIQPVLAHRWAGNLVALEGAKRAALGRPPDDVEYCRVKLQLPREVLDPPPLLTGDDLKRAGLKPGRDFARLLSEARAAQLDGEIATREEAIARALRG